MQDIKNWAARLQAAIGCVYFGKPEAVEKILAALLAQGHVLLDDLPGLGKTVLAKALAQSLGAPLSRIQATPDLLPSDVLGVSVYQPQTGAFQFRPGPLIAPVVLVDEINRATPRTQAALLEAMAERQVSAEGRSIALPKGFFLIATQNPVDFEGTFPLPEAQKDRFLLTLSLGYPDRATEARVLAACSAVVQPLEHLKAVSSLDELSALQEQAATVHVADSLRDYILDLAEATRRDANLRMGVSPRGSLALYRCAQGLAAIRGRDYAIPEDVADLVVPAFISRIIPRPQALVKGLSAADILQSIVAAQPVPRLAPGRAG